MRTVMRQQRRTLDRLALAPAILASAGLLWLAGCMPESNNKTRAGETRVEVNRAGKKDPLPRALAAADLKQGAGKTGRPAKEAAPQLAAMVLEKPGEERYALSASSSGPAPAKVALGGFYEALGALEKQRQGAVTILHLGDSHISADRFTGDLREQFQSRFGNAGRGLVMPGLFLARGVKSDQGGEWRMSSSAEGKPGPYGITGIKISAKASDAWLRWTSLDGGFDWAEVTLETGKASGSAMISVDGDSKLLPSGSDVKSWKTLRLNKKGRELLIRPKGDGEITLLSLAFGNEKPGVRYINLGLPGATAATPDKWEQSFAAADLKRLAPSLIILGYGTREGFDDELNIGVYEQRLAALMARLKAAAPDASFLIIGPPDAARMPAFASGSAAHPCRALSAQEASSYSKSWRAGDPRLARWHAPPKLQEVRATLGRAAAAHQAYFWDWSKFMGGPCSIHAWLHAAPPLASADHIHLTAEGSKRSARALFLELMSAYDSFERTAQR